MVNNTSVIFRPSNDNDDVFGVSGTDNWFSFSLARGVRNTALPPLYPALLLPIFTPSALFTAAEKFVENFLHSPLEDVVEMSEVLQYVFQYRTTPAHLFTRKEGIETSKVSVPQQLVSILSGSSSRNHSEHYITTDEDTFLHDGPVEKSAVAQELGVAEHNLFSAGVQFGKISESPAPGLWVAPSSYGVKFPVIWISKKDPTEWSTSYPFFPTFNALCSKNNSSGIVLPQRGNLKLYEFYQQVFPWDLTELNKLPFEEIIEEHPDIAVFKIAELLLKFQETIQVVNATKVAQIGEANRTKDPAIVWEEFHNYVIKNFC